MGERASKSLQVPMIASFRELLQRRRAALRCRPCNSVISIGVMNRRHFMTASASAGLAAIPASAQQRNAWFELRYIRMRTGTQTERTSDFLSKYFLPCVVRLGLGPVGFFSAIIGEESPFFLALISYPSAEAFATGMERMAADK